MTREEFKAMRMEQDPKMLDLDQISTPDALSEDEDEKKKRDSVLKDLDETDSESGVQKRKPHHEYIVRMKEEPKYKVAKNRFDSYLTKTSMRAITFSENKKRWQRVIDKDLYSKTLNRGVPTLQRVELRGQ